MELLFSYICNNNSTNDIKFYYILTFYFASTFLLRKHFTFYIFYTFLPLLNSAFYPASFPLFCTLLISSSMCAHSML